MSYNTIEKIGKGEYKSRGSKFFSFSHPISSIDDYRHLIAIYRKNFPESCHVCSAYRLLIGSRVDEQASDDGEPKGRAGQHGMAGGYFLCRVQENGNRGWKSNPRRRGGSKLLS